MKVRELIEQLQKCDPELLVVVDGYEGGVGELTKVQTTDIVLNHNKSWYYGEHELVSDLSVKQDEYHQIVTAVYLPR